MKKFFIELFFEGQRWYLRLHLTMINPRAFGIYLYTSYSNTCTCTHILQAAYAGARCLPTTRLPQGQRRLGWWTKQKESTSATGYKMGERKFTVLLFVTAQ